VHVLHVGKSADEAYFYYVMELADDVLCGQKIDPDNYSPKTLSVELARRGRLLLSEAFELGLTLSAAAKHLHQKHLIHRDIKPANIIFINGAPKLADIGLVSRIDESNTELGTLGYMPHGEKPGHLSDIYALGMVLYKAGTGNDPRLFPDLPVEWSAATDAALFASFNQIILKACAPPEKRYHSADALRLAIKNSLDPRKREICSERRERSAGERRHLTVLFAEITTEGNLDPESFQRIVENCLERIRPAVKRYEGALIQILSGALVASFGGTIAFEDHARRAALAALEIRRSLTGLAFCGEKFAVRMALNTGLAITSRAGEGLPLSGETINIASRIVANARPGEILSTAATCKLLAGYFELQPDESNSNGNTPKLFQITGAKAVRTRLEIEAERGLTPFVGRQKEMALLCDEFAHACEGRGRFTLLAGEAGMGKSRLLLEFQRAVERENVSWLTGRCISFGEQMAYLPVIDLLRQLFGIIETDDPRKATAAVEAEARRAGLDSTLPCFKYLLSLQSEDTSVAELEARERRARIFRAVRDALLAKAKGKPVVLVIEDVHWIDKTSEEFLVSLVDSVVAAPILAILTYRPGYRHPFPERSFITRTTLHPLTRAESLTLAARVAGAKALSQTYQQLAASKAEGNPFFLEELVKSLHEAGASREKSGETSERAELCVPNTIQDVIMSRIDRLEPSSRTTLQLASVIGREFSVNLLETIANLDEPLADSIEHLKKLELIYERAHFPEYICYFKHALTQEVAYNSLLIQRRKELHCLVAAALEEMHSGRLPEFYELLAHHYERGEEWARALDYLRNAAEQCRALGAYREETLQLTRAIAIAQDLGRGELIPELRGYRGAALVKIGKCAEAKPDLQSALENLPKEQHSRRAELLLSMAGAYFWGLDTQGARRYGAEGLEAARQARRNDLATEALTYIGASEQSAGNLDRAAEIFEKAIQVGGRFSASLANYPLTLYLTGRLAEAVEKGTEAARFFREGSDYFAANFAGPHLGLALAGCGRYAEAATVFEEARQLGVKHEIWHFHARAVAMEAGFHLDAFDFQGHELLVRQAVEHARCCGFRPTEVSATIDLVFNFIRSGRISDAERLIDDAETVAAQVKGWHEWLWDLRIKQARAELACAREDWEDALTRARDAIEKSSDRKRLKYVVLGLETRGRILAGQGKTAEAIVDLRLAVSRARAMGDPAIFLRAALTKLRVDGDDALLAETRDTARRIAAALPRDEMRQRFRKADAIQSLGQFDF
jgi:class 3 adenylate cyclase